MVPCKGTAEMVTKVKVTLHVSIFNSWSERTNTEVFSYWKKINRRIGIKILNAMKWKKNCNKMWWFEDHYGSDAGINLIKSYI